MVFQAQKGRIAEEPLKNTDYRWRRKLGEEAYGSVVAAEERATGRLVAIKLMDVQQVALMKNYVVRDVTEHAKCGAHPNVIQYFTCFATDKHLGVVTQYAAGGDLMSVINARKGLSEERARPLFQQLLVGLDFCTRMGLATWTCGWRTRCWTARGRPAPRARRARRTAPPQACRAPRQGRLLLACTLPRHHSSCGGLADACQCAPAGGAEPATESAAGSSGRADGEPGAPASAGAAAPGAGAAREGGAADAGPGAAGKPGCREDEAVLKLCAFGPSIRAHHSQPWRQDGGSLCYNPPEALISRRFEATADEAATVWICGVFLYAMLCNQYPFGDASNVRAVLDVRERMMKADFGRPTDRELSEEALDLLARIFVADPKQRITLAGIQAHAWLTAGEPEPLDLEAVNGPLAARCQAGWAPEDEQAVVGVVAQAAASAMEAMGSGDLNEQELDDLLDEDEEYDF